MVGRVAACARAGALCGGGSVAARPLCGGAVARCTPGRWRKGRSHDPARRGGSGSARCVRGLAGPQPAQRLPRAIPAPLRGPGVRTEGRRGERGGGEGGRGGGGASATRWAEAAGPRRALAGEAARAWTGRGTGERPRGGARGARSLPLPLGRVGARSAEPGGRDGSGPAGGEGSPSHARDEKPARGFAGARRRSPGPAASDCGWDFYFCTSRQETRCIATGKLLSLVWIGVVILKHVLAGRE